MSLRKKGLVIGMGLGVLGTAQGATWTLSNNCSLASAISSLNSGSNVGGCVADTSVNGYGSADTLIVPTGTTTVTTRVPFIEKSVIIAGQTGNRAENIIDGNGQRPFFVGHPKAVPDELTVVLRNITVQNAKAQGGSGNFGFGGGGGGAGLGGALFVFHGDVTLDGVLFSGNAATGGAGGGPGAVGGGGGGGMEGDGGAESTDSVCGGYGTGGGGGGGFYGAGGSGANFAADPNGYGGGAGGVCSYQQGGAGGGAGGAIAVGGIGLAGGGGGASDAHGGDGTSTAGGAGASGGWLYGGGGGGSAGGNGGAGGYGAGGGGGGGTAPITGPYPAGYVGYCGLGGAAGAGGFGGGGGGASDGGTTPPLGLQCPVGPAAPGGFGGGGGGSNAGGAATGGTLGGAGGVTGGGGGAGLGGAVFVQSGTLAMADVTFQNNTVTGGAGGTSGTWSDTGNGQALGAALFVCGSTDDPACSATVSVCNTAFGTGNTPSDIYDTGGCTPAAPGNLTAKAQNATTITLAWSATSTTVNGSQIYRYTGSDPNPIIINVAANLTSYSDTGLAPNTLYYYRLWPAAQSDRVAVTTPAATNVGSTGTPSNGGGGALDWIAVALGALFGRRRLQRG